MLSKRPVQVDVGKGKLLGGAVVVGGGTVLLFSVVDFVVVLGVLAVVLVVGG